MLTHMNQDQLIITALDRSPYTFTPVGDEYFRTSKTNPYRINEYATSDYTGIADFLGALGFIKVDCKDNPRLCSDLGINETFFHPEIKIYVHIVDDLTKRMEIIDKFFRTLGKLDHTDRQDLMNQLLDR